MPLKLQGSGEGGGLLEEAEVGTEQVHAEKERDQQVQASEVAQEAQMSEKQQKKTT